jgi:choline-glycine betaine transporter
VIFQSPPELPSGGSSSDEPEFSTVGWLTMLFAAGMGGLLYFGTTDPVSHDGIALASHAGSNPCRTARCTSSRVIHAGPSRELAGDAMMSAWE